MDLRGVIRAAFANLDAGGTVQGGSTITQQLAKNLFLTSERTRARKVQELILAFWLERRLSKEEILTRYLNTVYLGAGAYRGRSRQPALLWHPGRAVDPGPIRHARRPDSGAIALRPYALAR